MRDVLLFEGTKHSQKLSIREIEQKILKLALLEKGLKNMNKEASE